jgi:hypothetical protein
MAVSFTHWLPSSHPILTFYPIGAPKVLPCPTASLTLKLFLAHVLLIILKMEEANTCETSVDIYQTILCNIPENGYFNMIKDVEFD